MPTSAEQKVFHHVGKSENLLADEQAIPNGDEGGENQVDSLVNQLSDSWETADVKANEVYATEKILEADLEHPSLSQWQLYLFEGLLCVEQQYLLSEKKPSRDMGK